MFKPDKTNTLKGIYGLILKDIPKEAFVHTFSESERFPYNAMQVGMTLEIYPNLSTVPQTKGLYLNDTHICDIGSPLQEEYIAILPASKGL